MTNTIAILKFANFRLLLLLALFMLGGIIAIAQDEESPSTEKKKARISLTYTNYNNIGPRLIATVKTKEERSYVKVKGVKVNFYFGEMEDAKNIGHAVSNVKGEAILILPETLRKIITKQDTFVYIAAIEDDERFKDEETDIEIRRSKIDLTLDIQDSVKQVRFFIGAPDSSGLVAPVEGVEGRIFVKRLFGLLPISEDFETTDEDGYFTVDFPDDIPGDEQGILAIVTKVEDHEEFGTLIASKKINWGIPIQVNDLSQSRELWSARANAPFYLIIVVNSLVFGIWGMIGYIILQLFKIRKMGTKIISKSN